MTIEINDIQKRNHMNSTIYKSSQMNLNHIPLYTKDHRFIKENAFHIIEHWQSIDPSDSHSSFLKAMDAFDEVCEHCSDGEIDKYYNVLSEAVTKVRDASQLANSIKHRTSRFKTKISTRINNSIDTIHGANTAKLNNISNKLAAAIKPATPPQASGDTSGIAQQEAYYEKLSEKINKAVECDRILRNYNRISKRFNFDRMVSDIYDESLIYECIVEMCRCIDTYNTGFINKYETALENTYYVLNKKYLNYPNDKIVEAVTDYFVIEKSITENEIETIERLKNTNNCIFKESDFDQVKYLFNKETIDSDLNVASVVPDPSGYGVDFFTLNEESLVDKAKNKVKKLSAGDTTKEKEEAKKMLDDFRASCVATKEKQGEVGNQHLNNLKSLIRRIYTKSPEQIAAGLPNIFTLLRTFFIISPCAINPILSIPALIADQAIKLTLERTNLDKIITAYKNEINLIQTKIEKEKNQENKSRLEAYLKELNSDMEKIKKYEDDLYSEEENEKRKEAEYSFDDDFDFDDDDWDDEDWDDEDFEEAHTQLLNLSSIMLISELAMSSQELLADTSVDKVVRNNIVKFSNESLDELTDFSLIVPDILNRSELLESMSYHREQLRSQESKDISDLVRIDCLSENIYKLENSTTTYNPTSDMKSIICTLNCLNELVNYTNSSYIMEMNFTNSIKLAINRLKKTTMKLDTKQKQISNTIDVSMNNVSKGIETAMMNDNREAVIRGSVLPSASKVIKLAITTGAAWAINPAIAVIGALGSFACSKKLKAKERQLVLDDIEIELKMCERYLRQAEDKNDMQAIRQIEITQRNLQRQQQRIKYKMNVVYKQNVPDIKNEDD